MPFDILGWGEAAPGANGSLAALLEDSFYTVSGDDIDVKLHAPWLLGIQIAAESTGGGASLSQPSLAQDYDFDQCALLSADSPLHGFKNLRYRPLPLIPGEKVNCTMDNATDEDAIVAIWLGDGRITTGALESVNPTHIIDGVADDTLTAFTWKKLTVTWAQTLPKGRYVPVGMRFSYFKSSVAMPAIARLMFQSAPASGWRPGVMGHEAQADHEEDQTSPEHPFDIWPFMPELEFTNKTIPNIEVCGAEATTDENIELLLTKVG